MNETLIFSPVNYEEKLPQPRPDDKLVMVYLGFHAGLKSMFLFDYKNNKK